MVFIELQDGTKTSGAPVELQISGITRQKAHELYEEGIDIEYTHIYIYCMENIEVLHNAKIIHGDVKPDILINCALVDRSDIHM